MGCVGEHQCHLLQGCMMYEEQFSSVRQFDAGQQHAQVYGSGMDAADIYERVAPQSVEESVISAARDRLAALPLDRPPAMNILPPVSWLPAFARNHLFVGREAEFARMAALLKARDLATVVLAGWGGVGKSQLAAEFVYRYRSYFAGGIFWLRFAMADAVPSEVARCAIFLSQELRLNVRMLPVEEQIKLVLACWQSPLPRLLVFDTCEDEALLARWRPPRGGCRIVVTSRRRIWHPNLAVTQMEVSELERTQSVELLGAYRADISVRDRELIAQELGDLPLALAAAGAYLHTHRESPLGDVGRYLRSLRRANPLAHASLQQEGTTFPTEHSEHIARTFALSYEQLDPTRPIDATALRVLARIASLAPGEPIPRDLLHLTMGSAGDKEEDERFDGALKRLYTLGLLTWRRDGTLYMHRLLALFVQMRLTSTDAAAEVRPAVEAALLQRVREINARGYPALLLPLREHLRTITAHADQREDVMAADLNAAFGTHLRMTGAYREAQEYLERALSIREQRLGRDHPDVVTLLDNLAELSREQGKYREAEPLYQRAWYIREQFLGAGDPQMATSLYNLANLYFAQEQYEEAEPLYRRVLEIWQQNLGEEHPQVAYPLNNLALLYREQRKYEEAEPFYWRALRIWQHSLGPEHPQVATLLNNLALLFRDRGKYKEAELLYQRALRIREKNLGEEHSLVAYPLNGLANLYYEQGKYAEAESLYRQALCIRERSLGSDHPLVAYPLNGLASLYYEQGKYEEAEPLYQRALQIWEKGLGEEHPHTQMARANYSSLVQVIGLNSKQLEKGS